MPTRAYSTHRPVSIGTYPKGFGLIEIHNYDCRQRVDAIRREAFGYIDYAEDVPREALDAFELVTEETERPPELPSERVLAQLAKVYRSGDQERFVELFERCEAKGYDSEALDDALSSILYEQ